MPITTFLDFGRRDSENKIGRILITLNPRAPRAAENFRQFCTGEFRPDGVPTGYKGCKVLSIRDGVLLTGDFVYNNGVGSQSIYGSAYFSADDLETPVEAYRVVMWNQGSPSTNGCQFMITGQRHTEMDGKFEVVGSISESMHVIDKLLRYSSYEDIYIVECGEM